MDILNTKLGLSDKESAVFLAVLETGAETVSNIAKRANLNRTTTYDILESLNIKGLVGVVGDRKKRTYIAEPPEKLVTYLEKRSKDYQERAKEALKYLPQLKGLYNDKGIKPRVLFYDGRNGIEQVYEDTLTSSETIRAYASVRDMHQALPDYFPDYYIRRSKKDIHIRAILPNTPEGVERKRHDREEARESQLVPVETFDFSPEINIYDNKVAIMSLAESFGVIIESKEIAEAQKKIFELAWIGAKSLNQSQAAKPSAA